MRSAMRSKVRASWPSSSRRVDPTRADKIAAAEALHGLLQRAHRPGQMERQPVAEQHRGAPS